MKSLVKNIANIFSGVYAKAEPSGDVYYIQARDINHKHELSSTLSPQLIADGKIDKHFLQKGDILIAAKGKDHYAIEYKGSPAPAVASTLFIVIRVKQEDKVLPTYLQWYINLPNVQSKLSNEAQGSVIPVISKAELENLVIPLPALQVQKTVLKIDQLRNTESELIKEIESLKRKAIDQQILNALSN